MPSQTRQIREIWKIMRSRISSFWHGADESLALWWIHPRVAHAHGRLLFTVRQEGVVWRCWYIMIFRGEKWFVCLLRLNVHFKQCRSTIKIKLDSVCFTGDFWGPDTHQNNCIFCFLILPFAAKNTYFWVPDPAASAICNFRKIDLKKYGFMIFR